MESTKFVPYMEENHRHNESGMSEIVQLLASLRGIPTKRMITIKNIIVKNSYISSNLCSLTKSWTPVRGRIITPTMVDKIPVDEFVSKSARNVNLSQDFCS